LFFVSTFAAALLFGNGKFPAGFQKDEVDGSRSDLDRIACAVGFPRGASDEGILRLVKDKIIVFEFGDVEEAF
jgi:hypothetical protein